MATSKPQTVAVPPSALSSVDKILTRVVLPAPLEPSSAKMLPGATARSTPLRTLTSPKDFWSPEISMADFVVMHTASRVDPTSRSSPTRSVLYPPAPPSSPLTVSAGVAQGRPDVAVPGGLVDQGVEVRPR